MLQLLEQVHVFVLDLGHFPSNFVDEVVELNYFFLFPFLIFCIIRAFLFGGLDSVDKLVDFDDVEDFSGYPSAVIPIQGFLLLTVQNEKRGKIVVNLNVSFLPLGNDFNEVLE